MRRFGLGVLSLIEVQPADVVVAGGDGGMIRPQTLFPRRQRLPIRLLRFGELPLRLERVGHAVERGGHRRVVGPQQFRPHRERTLEQFRGLLELTQVGGGVCHVVGDVRDLPLVPWNLFLVSGQRLSVHGQRTRTVPLVPKHRPQVVENRAEFRAGGAVGRRLNFEALLIQGLRLGVVPRIVVHGGQIVQTRGDFGIPRTVAAFGVLEHATIVVGRFQQTALFVQGHRVFIDDDVGFLGIGP